MNKAPETARAFDLALPPLELEAGAVVRDHFVRGWWWGPSDDLAVLESLCPVTDDAESASAGQIPVKRSRADLGRLHEKCAMLRAAKKQTLDRNIPTVVIVHALTGDARAGGKNGWWEPLIGPGLALDPDTHRLLCFNLLGSCYGTSGFADEGFPTRADDSHFLPSTGPELDGYAIPETKVPATITTYDQARSILMALNELGIESVHLITGGSLGAMVLSALAALEPFRCERILPIGAFDYSSSWIIGWNHVQRAALLLDPGFPDNPRRGLSLARQIGMLTYRSEKSLEIRQGRNMADESDWSSRAHYRVHTYLEHQGSKLLGRFHGGAYLSMIGAMDHHDLARIPWWIEDSQREFRRSWGVERIQAAAMCVGIDTDELFFPENIRRFADKLVANGNAVSYDTLITPHGHDGFLIEMEQMDSLLRRAMILPGPKPPMQTG